MYALLRNMLFWFPPERVHHLTMAGLSVLHHIPGMPKMLQPAVTRNLRLQKELFGLHFRNPVGLAAGFDKNALYLDELDMLGFGSLEIGTVTPEPQPGNDKPRLFRIPEHCAIINRMGFNNDGVKTIAQRLRSYKAYATGTLIIGGNIGKNKNTPNEDAWKDYERCFRELFDCVDYFVVNVSSPNTPGLRELQEKDSLKKILSHLQDINLQQGTPKAILLKISPDLSTAQLDDVIDLAMSIPLDGLVATNTTISRDGLSKITKEKIEEMGNGGLSGQPLQTRSTEVVRRIHSQTGGKLPIIASGGIFTAGDAIEKLNAGAAMVQVWTGFIYLGPGIVKDICRGLLPKANQ